MKLIFMVLICCSLGACSTLSQIQEDGGFWCSEHVNYFSDSELVEKRRIFKLYKYSEVLSGDYTGLGADSAGSAGQLSSRMKIENQGLYSKNVSISMHLEVNEVEKKPIEIGVCSFELELCTKQKAPIFRYLLPPESLFQISFLFDSVGRNVTSIKQTLLIGESEPSDVIVSRNLTKSRYTLNCIFGSGTANPP